jgi:glycosyltransferase involved in cell wall biosynthesis
MDSGSPNLVPPPLPRITVVIPALNEAPSIGRVLGDFPRSLLHEVIVVDNGSTDATAEIARKAGARVVDEPRRGYGRACLAGIAAADRPDIFVFVDADYSDHPEELPLLLEPILAGRADLVIGARAARLQEAGAMPPHARFGNWLATRLMALLWGYRFADLGPFRAVTAKALRRIGMRDETYGWTIEMQIKALRLGLRVVEIPVSYRRRLGSSKITGTVRGTFGAGSKILWMIFKYGVLARGAGPEEAGGKKPTLP